jgi:hypothetical protein
MFVLCKREGGSVVYLDENQEWTPYFRDAWRMSAANAQMMKSVHGGTILPD